MENPLQPPSTELREPTVLSTRPFFVWVFSIWFGLGALATLLSNLVLASGAVTPLGIFTCALTLGFVVQLFRLKRPAVAWAIPVPLLLAVRSAIAITELPDTARAPGVARNALGILAWLAAGLYARRLRARGVLR